MNDQQQSRADALTDEHIATLKLAARAVTPQDIDGAERIESRPDGSYITCPACEGEGCIPFESDYCNYDHVAIGVQFYGVGTEPGAAEAYFRAAKPATILALLDRLERAESALAAPPVEQPAAAPADERAAQNKGYFVYDPEGNGFELYATDAERAEAHNTAIKECRQEAIDDGEWPLEVESIVSGIVTHLTVATQVDGDSCDYEARAAASPTAEVVRLEHVATAEDGGKLRWMTGRRPRDCELYARPDGGRVPATLYATPQPAQADAPAEAREPLNEVLFGNDEALEMAADALDRLGQDSAAAGVRALRMLAHKMRCAPADAAEAAPFGWAQPKGGNYFTRNELSAKRIGGLVPVYTAPAASRMARLTDEQRESIEHAATWLGRSEDLQNKAHAKRLRALLNGADR